MDIVLKLFNAFRTDSKDISDVHDELSVCTKKSDSYKYSLLFMGSVLKLKWTNIYESLIGKLVLISLATPQLSELCTKNRKHLENFYSLPRIGCEAIRYF